MQFVVNTKIYLPTVLQESVEQFAEIAEINLEQCDDDRVKVFVEIKDKDFEDDFEDEYMNYLLEATLQN